MLTLVKVQNPRLITSYALPPQTRFACAPCSIYRKIGGRKSAQRLTFAVVSNESHRKSELICFTEETQKDPSAALSAGNQTKATYQLRQSKSKVLEISAVVVDSEAPDAHSALDVSLVYEDGHVETIAGDLSLERWQVASKQLVSSDSTLPSGAFGHVEFATVMDVAAARKGLLKGREDALATLESDTAAAAVSLLVLATSSETGSARSLHVYALKPRSKDIISSSRQSLQHLLSYELPRAGAADENSTPAEYSLHASTGKLYQLLAGTITTYDLSGTLPRVLSQLHSRQSGYQSFTRIAPTALLAIQSGSCGIFDTVYSSVQAMLAIPAGETALTGEKRKHVDTQTEGQSLQFVTFFSELGLAVALSGNSLVGIQISSETVTRKRGKAQPSLLINSIGKGVGSQLRKKAETDAAWATWTAKIDEFVENADLREFESFLAEELGVTMSKSSRKKKQKESADSSKPLANGVSDHEQEADADKDSVHKNLDTPPKWRFPSDLSSVLRRTERPKALYCLSKIFGWSITDEEADEEAQPSSSISINFFAPNVLQWLALTGYVSAPMVQKALRETSDDAFSTSRVEHGDIIKAINEFDPEMRFMHELMSWPIHLDIQEIAQGLKALIQSLDSPPAAAITKALTMGQSSEQPADNEMELDLRRDIEAAEDDLTYALRALDSGLAVRSLALRTVFTRLHAFPTSTVVRTLRTTLTQHELVFFIQILRIELADGGWTSRYVDAEVQRADAGTPSDRSIAIISSLLNAAIDAVGTSGWLVGLSSAADVAADEMLATLRAETSAALEGCYEASALGGFLNDFERYSRLLQESEQSVPGKARNAKVDPIRAPGFEVVPKAEDSILPLGYKIQGPASRMRMTSGGVLKPKSKSLLGKEISMRVGKYSLDRIRV